uniref:Uncharacterized protein n=1 Tax=Romanomermis culicivorax TaxID=13658 RepID=A0A915IJE3_ROMCU
MARYRERPNTANRPDIAKGQAHCLKSGIASRWIDSKILTCFSYVSNFWRSSHILELMLNPHLILFTLITINKNHFHLLIGRNHPRLFMNKISNMAWIPVNFAHQILERVLH